MSFTSQDFESYVPVYDSVPDKWEDAKPFIVEQLKKISNAVNIREIGWFLDEELLSGKAFIPGITPAGNPQTYRSVLRKVIDFGPLPAAGTKTVPHGILFDINFTLISLTAAATNPTNFVAFSPVYAPSSDPNGVQMYMDSTSIYITVNNDRSAYTRCFVTVEYIQEL